MPVHPKVTAATAGAALAVIASAICDAAGRHLPVTVWPADAELPNPAPRSDMARDGSSFARSLRGNS
jgi:hypothetical protein